MARTARTAPACTTTLLVSTTTTLLPATALLAALLLCCLGCHNAIVVALPMASLAAGAHVLEASRGAVVPASVRFLELIADWKATVIAEPSIGIGLVVICRRPG